MPTEAAPDTTAWVSLGAGGHAASVVDALRDVARLVGIAGESSRSWTVQRFDTDAEAVSVAQSRGWKVLATVGDNRVRLGLVDTMPHDVMFSPVAASATVAVDAELGAGAVVLNHAHVGPLARIGRGVIVNTGAIVEHDVAVDDGAHIAPGAVVLGGSRIGACAMIGSGARILPGRTIGADSVVGSGAVVIDDVAAGATVVGQPARRVARQVDGP